MKLKTFQRDQKRHQNKQDISFIQNENLIKIEGYCSVFNVQDAQGDIIVKNSFITDRNIKEIPILWQHDFCCPIGHLIYAQEDDFGLYIKGFITNETQKGKEAISLIEREIIRKLSIGYEIYNNLLLLKEVSVVTFPANDETSVVISSKN